MVEIFYFSFYKWKKMTSIEEIKVGIQKRVLERETAVKKMLAEIEKKRAEIKKGIEKYKEKFSEK